MDYTMLAGLHLATVIPAFFIASAQFCLPKGTAAHRLAGRVFMVLMLLTALLTLFMANRVGPTLFGHFGFIHGLSVFVLWAVPRAWQAARNGDIHRHRRIMVLVYLGGLLLAGGLAFAPGRMLHEWLFMG